MDNKSRMMREYQVRFCERLEVKFLWPTRLSGDPIIADALLDRIIHQAERITLSGESVRKLKKISSASCNKENSN
jgi:DNA replication protein DnaC